MKKIRFAVVGTGNIGQQHINLLRLGEIEGAELAATVSRSGSAVDTGVPHFGSLDALLDAECCDAVLIATPTMDHVSAAKSAARRGLHVLLEKPIAMSVGQSQALIDEIPESVEFAVMLNQRFHPAYAAIKQLLDEDRIGTVKRYTWTMTAWYRPDVYYKVSRWRGTWPGEGGGLLINQCIHNLDIIQWLFGLPEKISAKVAFGRYHDIDVEDEVTAMLDYESGSVGLLQASSGEAPGINRLEIIGDTGVISWNDSELTLQEADQSVSEHCATTREMFGMPSFTSQTLDLAVGVNQHAQVIQNFVDSLIKGSRLLTPAREGLGSLQLANGMLLSQWDDKAVALPIDSQRYEQLLSERIASSSLREAHNIEVEIDMEKSYR